MADADRCRAAVLGRPVAHSLSPLLHRAAYRSLGAPQLRYEAIDCGIDELPAVMDSRPDWLGFSCTMPLKRAAVAVADELGPVAELLGVANTLVASDARGWLAENTDAAGILGALRSAGVAPSDVCVLGAGATAAAALAACGPLGIDAVTVLVRDTGRTERAQRLAERVGLTLRIAALSADAVELGAELVISTLPPHAADPIAARGWTSGQAVLDVVYDGWPTALARAAGAAGARVVPGADMLLHQAVEQVELMTGLRPDVEPMRAALREAVRADR